MVCPFEPHKAIILVVRTVDHWLYDLGQELSVPIDLGGNRSI